MKIAAMSITRELEIAPMFLQLSEWLDKHDGEDTPEFHRILELYKQIERGLDDEPGD
jgi:hypothetical protein